MNRGNYLNGDTLIRKVHMELSLVGKPCAGGKPQDYGALMISLGSLVHFCPRQVLHLYYRTMRLWQILSNVSSCSSTQVSTP